MTAPAIAAAPATDPLTPGIPPARMRVLCVDDAPLVLGGLARTLRLNYDVRTAAGGRAGIEALAADREIAVVISDLRMPGLDGATFLACARRGAPAATRVVLTGQADVADAIAAVNEGQVFRFLLKPIDARLLRSAVDAAVAQHRAFEDQRAQLEQLVPESVALFVQHLLARVDPAACARAARLKRFVAEVGPRLTLGHRWPVEVAAVLSQVGVLAPPRTLRDRGGPGHALAPGDQRAALDAPLLGEQLLAGIPLVDSVRYILRHAARPLLAPVPGLAQTPDQPPGDRAPEPGADAAGVLGARLLRFALAYEEMASQGTDRATILATLARYVEEGDAPVLAALRAHATDVMDDAPVSAALGEFPAGAPEAHTLTADADAAAVRVVCLSEVHAGMQFVADVRTDGGLLLVAGGQVVTPALVDHIRRDWQSFAASLRVHVSAPSGAATADA